MGDPREPDRLLAAISERIVLPPSAGPRRPSPMSSHDQVLFGQFVTSVLATSSLAVVFYLARLKFAEMRKRRRMARAGEQFGLIQPIVGTGKFRASSLPSTRSVAPPVKSLDTSVKRWTLPASSGPTRFQWN